MDEVRAEVVPDGVADEGEDVDEDVVVVLVSPPCPSE